VQRDEKRYREVVEKVILYMTLGIDVSRLFSEMVLVSRRGGGGGGRKRRRRGGRKMTVYVCVCVCF